MPRARMLLLLQEAAKNQKQIARDCPRSEGTVTKPVKTLQRRQGGSVKDVLEEKPRSGQAHAIITPELEANITALARCAEGPDGRSAWTLDLIAGKMVKDGLAVHPSYETARKVLKKAGSNPGKKSSGASVR